MDNQLSSIITATGSFLPPRKVSGSDFNNSSFFDTQGVPITHENEKIIAKFQDITGIKERRYSSPSMDTSDMAYEAAKNALESGNVDPETLDYIIVAHNFGDICPVRKASSFVPSLASKVKYKLGITNPNTVAYDIAFGCPGWVQAMIQANYFIKSGDAKKVMIIGAEMLSRVTDPHDRDSMIYSDGAGATILESKTTKNKTGIISHVTRTDTTEEVFYLKMDKSYNPNYENQNQLFLKMQGRNVYKYALNKVPEVVLSSLKKAEVPISKIKKILVHQANEKMDEAIGARIFNKAGCEMPKNIMPMTIQDYGNNSVATVPILLDLLLKNKLDNHYVEKDDYIIFASVGAGMNVNSMVYQL